MKKRLGQGFTFFTYSMDTMILSAAAKAVVDEARQSITEY